MLVTPLLPRIAEQLTVPESLLGMLVTAYALSVGFFALVAGPISDRVGRRAILLWGTAMEAVALLLHALAFDFVSLLAIRFLAGAAGGVLTGAAVAYVGDYFPRERRGWANGWVLSGFAAGQILGIPAGAIAAASHGFQAPFLAFGCLMVATWVLIWWAVPQPPAAPTAGRFSLRLAVRGYAALLRMRQVRVSTMLFGLMFAASAMYLSYLPVWIEMGLGRPATAVAAMFLIGGIANVVVGPLAGGHSDRIGRRKMVVAASAGLAMVMFLTPLATLEPALLYLFFFLVMALFATRAAPFQTLLMDIVPANMRGSLMSLVMAVGQAMFGLGGALAGPVYVTIGYESSALIAGGIGTIVVFVMIRYLREDTAGQTPAEQTAYQPLADAA
jgi:predicted MFS family arabinose efflux permease